jgi:hypothetical protein
MEHLENDMECHNVYLLMLDCSANILIPPMHAETVTHPTLAGAFEIRSLSSRKDCGSGGWYAWSFTYYHS